MKIRQAAPEIGPGTGVGGVAFNLERAWQVAGIDTERFTMAEAHGGWIPRISSGPLSRPALAARVVWFSTVGTALLRRRIRADDDTVTICHNDALAGQIYVNHGLVLTAMRARGHAWLRMSRNPLHLFTHARDRWRYDHSRAHRVVVNLVPQDDAAMRRTFRRLRADTVVIGNGVDTDRFRPPSSAGRQAARRRLGYDPDDFVIVFIGHEHDRKGLPLLLRALVDLPESTRMLVVGGDGSSIRRSRSQADSLGVACRTRFTGAVDDPTPYLHAGDLLGCPSAYESYGLVVAEALASGLPVISTATGAAPDLLRDGVNGYLIERTAGAVTTAVTAAMAADRAAMRLAARQTALEHSWARVASRYVDLAAQVADSR